MKKLLMILMIGAGFVTVASANQSLVCDLSHPNCQCCLDVLNIQGTINHAISQAIITQDGNRLAWVDEESVINDGIDGTNCIDNGIYFDANGQPHNQVLVTWVPGNWLHSIRTYSDVSAK